MGTNSSAEVVRRFMAEGDARKSYPFKHAAEIYGVLYGDVLRLSDEMPEMSGHFIDMPVVKAVLYGRALEAERRRRVKQEEANAVSS